MHDPIGSYEQFDEVVDVVCAGTGPGVLAFALACAAQDQTVLIVESVSALELTDPETVEYVQAITEDLGSVSQDVELAVTTAKPLPPPKGDRPRIEPFLGGRLRQWSATCLGSAFGVMCSDVIDIPMTPLRTKAEPIRAIELGTYAVTDERPGRGLVDWLTAQVAEQDLMPQDGWNLKRLIFEGGVVAGAVLDGPSGPYRVRARECVVLNPGPTPGIDEWPAQAVEGAALQVALVGRTAARFGRIELLELV